MPNYKKMYGVVHEKYTTRPDVILLATKKYQAISLWEIYNNGSSFKSCMKDGWIVKTYNIKLL